MDRLVKMGADRNIKNNEGKRPIDLIDKYSPSEASEAQDMKKLLNSETPLRGKSKSVLRRMKNDALKEKSEKELISFNGVDRVIKAEKYGTTVTVYDKTMRQIDQMKTSDPIVSIDSNGPYSMVRTSKTAMNTDKTLDDMLQDKTEKLYVVTLDPILVLFWQNRAIVSFKKITS